MRQLTFIKPGDFEWWDVTSPEIAAETDAIVHPLAVARCDIDYYIATGAAKCPGPFAFGHEMVGEVIDVGEKVPFVPGDKVIVPFQLSCGHCACCRRGQTNACLHFPLGAAFGLKPTSKTEYGGALSDLTRRIAGRDFVRLWWISSGAGHEPDHRFQSGTRCNDSGWAKGNFSSRVKGDRCVYTFIPQGAHSASLHLTSTKPMAHRSRDDGVSALFFVTFLPVPSSERTVRFRPVPPERHPAALRQLWCYPG